MHGDIWLKLTELIYYLAFIFACLLTNLQVQIAESTVCSKDGICTCELGSMHAMMADSIKKAIGEHSYESD